MSKSSELFIQTATEADDLRDAGLTIPADILRYTDLDYYGDGLKWHLLDIYRPADAKGKLPVIFDIHGGGWVYGDKDRYQYYCMDLARRDFAVINFSYRLAPDFKFPAQLEDINRAAAFVAENAKTYGLDLDNVFGMGDSAGAHMLGIYANILTNPDYAAAFNFKADPRFAFKAIALNCGCYDIEAEGSEQSMELMTDLLPGGPVKEALNRINVCMHMTDQFPPTYVMTATGDFLKPQMALLTQKLTQYDIPHISRFFTACERKADRHREEELGHVFHLNIRKKEACILNDAECDFFKAYIS